MPRLRLLIVALLGSMAVPSHPAAQPRPDVLRDQVVLTLPGMESVRVDSGITFSEAGGQKLKLDLFHPVPPTTKGAEKPGTGRTKSAAPVVIFVNGVGMTDPPLRRWGVYQSWGRLVAVSGMAAVTHDSRPAAPREDLAAVVAHLRANAARYGIDPENIGIWASSANLVHGSWYALNPANAHVKAAVFYYGTVDTTYLRTDLPVLAVRSGLDPPFNNGSLNAFVARAFARNAPITAINLSNGRHAFDVFDPDETSRDIVRTTLSFLRDNLGPEMQRARGLRAPQVRTFARSAAQDWEGTLAAATDWLAREPESGMAFQMTADAQYRLRRYREAAEAYERAASLRWQAATTFYNAACSWALAGERERALTSLERAVETGFITNRAAIAADPDLVSLKADPRFLKLVESP